MGEWSKAGENLVRHRAGTYYLRAKVAGKVIRVSLETSDLRIAKLKRDSQLDKLRQAAKDERSREMLTLGDGLREAEKAAIGPHLKPSTRKDYRKRFTTLRENLPLKAQARRWSADDARQWWRTFSEGRSPQKANQALRFLRKALSLLVEAGAIRRDPTADLKAIRLVGKRRALPSRQEIESVIADVRSQRKRCSHESANYIAFLAFTGCRHGEIRALTWEDIGPEWITVAGGEDGTKNRQVRQVPIVPALADIIGRMRYDRAAGPVFQMVTPRIALGASCKRLGLSHMRLHDLRHWFGSWAIESGVDIPTVAKWMGHQDGGALLMKTYAHLSDRHSLEQAKRLR